MALPSGIPSWRDPSGQLQRSRSLASRQGHDVETLQVEMCVNICAFGPGTQPVAEQFQM